MKTTIILITLFLSISANAQWETCSNNPFTRLMQGFNGGCQPAHSYGTGDPASGVVDNKNLTDLCKYPYKGYKIYLPDSNDNFNKNDYNYVWVSKERNTPTAKCTIQYVNRVEFETQKSIPNLQKTFSSQKEICDEAINLFYIDDPQKAISKFGRVAIGAECAISVEVEGQNSRVASSSRDDSDQSTFWDLIGWGSSSSQ